MGITTGSGPKRPEFAKKEIMMNNTYCASQHHKQASRFTYLADPTFPQDSNFLLSLVAAEIGSWGSLQAPAQNGQNLQKKEMMNDIYCASNHQKHFQARKLMKSSRTVGSPCLMSRLNRRWPPRGQNVHRLCYLPPANLLKQRGRSSCVHSSPALLARTAEFTGPKNRHT